MIWSKVYRSHWQAKQDGLLFDIQRIALSFGYSVHISRIRPLDEKCPLCQGGGRDLQDASRYCCACTGAGKAKFDEFLSGFVCDQTDLKRAKTMLEQWLLDNAAKLQQCTATFNPYGSVHHDH